MVILALYFILVFGWAIFVIVLKCRKARAKRLAEQEGVFILCVHIIFIR